MEREAAIERLTREMKEAAKLLEFEHAAFLRDQIDRLRRGENPTVDSAAETERKQNHAQTQRKGEKIPWQTIRSSSKAHGSTT